MTLFVQYLSINILRLFFDNTW